MKLPVEIKINNTKLLNLKSGDRFIADLNLNDGKRYYEIRMGYKYAKVRAIYSDMQFKRISARKLKELIKSNYWAWAKADAFHIALANGKKLSRTWHKNYGV